ncbi:ZIP family metal transporter [Comamonas sp. J-3]|uniref:ZIP family metal transporter n=1 Tax=Comamonas trifloxystrobinivorans TaxID=3350256 RepID=UPI0037285DB7
MDHSPVPASPNVSPAGSPPLRLKTRIGLAICALGVFALCALVWRGLQHQPSVRHALLGGSMAALATALGTLPVLLAQRPSERLRDALFGFGAGVMLAACAFSLVLPALEAARHASVLGGSAWAAGGVVGSAILLGGAALLVMDRLLPHEHFIKGREGASTQQLRRAWLFVFAITLHNLPEGLAIGVGYAGNEGLRANALAIGIAIQDVPEGFVVAAALLSVGYTRGFAVLLGMLSGLVEPVGAVIGAAIIGSSALLLPWGLGFAAGAMLFVISHEIIPESHRQGHEFHATTGLMLGFVLMMVLDTALG